MAARAGGHGSTGAGEPTAGIGIWGARTALQGPRELVGASIRSGGGWGRRLYWGVSRCRVEARTALNSFVRRAGTAHRGDRRSDGGLYGRQTWRMAGTRCEDRGRTSRGLWGARRLGKARGLGLRAARKPRAAAARGAARARRGRALALHLSD
jgi:hypothetical protein